MDSKTSEKIIANDDLKVLIIPSSKLNLDLVAACFSIARIIKAVEGKTVEIFIDPESIPAYISEIFPSRDLKFINQIKPKSFLVKLENKDAKIKDIKWEEKDGSINLYISTGEGKIEGNAEVKAIGDKYDKIITIGIQKLDQIGDLYKNNKDIFDSIKIINLDTSSFNTNFGSSTYVKTNASSLSEIAYEYLTSNGLQPTSKEATDLLSGIIWKTKSFKIRVENSSTFQTCADLLNINADFPEAVKKAYQTLNLLQIRYVNEILKNVEVSSDNIAWAKVNKENLNVLDIKEVLFPDANILNYLKNIKAAFVLTETLNSEVLCDFRSNQKGIKASKIAEAFGAEGSSTHANFIIKASIDDAQKQVLNEIRTALSGGFPKTKKDIYESIEEKIEDEKENLPLEPKGNDIQDKHQPQEEIIDSTPQLNIATQGSFDPLPPATNTPWDLPQ